MIKAILEYPNPVAALAGKAGVVDKTLQDSSLWL